MPTRHHTLPSRWAHSVLFAADLPSYRWVCTIMTGIFRNQAFQESACFLTPSNHIMLREYLPESLQPVSSPRKSPAKKAKEKGALGHGCVVKIETSNTSPKSKTRAGSQASRSHNKDKRKLKSETKRGAEEFTTAQGQSIEATPETKKTKRIRKIPRIVGHVRGSNQISSVKMQGESGSTSTLASRANLCRESACIKSEKTTGEKGSSHHQ